MKVAKIVNEEKRTCVVVITEAEQLVRERIEKDLKQAGIYAWVDDQYMIAPKFVGIAKCHPSDEFDSEVGLELAKKRAKEKLTKEKIRQYTRLQNKFKALFKTALEPYTDPKS